MVEIGDKVRDVITGYEGIVVAYSKWAFNSDTVAIQKQMVGATNLIDEAMWLDVNRVAILKKGELKNYVQEPVKNSFDFLDKVKDTVNGFDGKIVGFTTWFSGCIRATVTLPYLNKDNDPIELHFPVGQLLKIESGVEDKKKDEKEKVGGPMRHPVCR